MADHRLERPWYHPQSLLSHLDCPPWVSHLCLYRASSPLAPPLVSLHHLSSTPLALERLERMKKELANWQKSVITSLNGGDYPLESRK